MNEFQKKIIDVLTILCTAATAAAATARFAVEYFETFIKPNNIG